MRRSSWASVGLLGGCVMVISACFDTQSSSGVTTQASSPQTATTDLGSVGDETAGTLFGVAGLIPPNFSNPSQEDWDALI